MKFAQYLPSFGWAPSVVAPRHGFFYPDDSLDTSGISVERTLSFELSRAARWGLLRRSSNDLAAARQDGPLSMLQRMARRYLYRPDAHVGWYPFALLAARRILRDQRFSVLFSSSSPITSHLIARTLSKEFAIPWVAEFRDPWTDVASYDSAWRKRCDRRLEAELLGGADAVVTVSDGMVDLLRGRGAGQTFAIPNGFDPDDFPPTDETDDTIAYLGTYYPGRQDLDTALAAIGSLVAKGELPSTRLLFIGQHGSDLRRLVARFGLATRLEEVGFVPHRTALRLIARARVLLLAGLADRTSATALVRGVLPAKTFEYLGARRPILYIGNVHGDVAALLRQTAGAEVVPSGDHEGALRALRSLLHAPRPALAPGAMAFTRRALAGRLADVLEQVSSRA